MKFEPSSDFTTYSSLGIADEEVIHEFNLARIIECELTDERVDDLKRFSNVLYVERDIPVYAYQQEIPYGVSRVQT